MASNASLFPHHSKPKSKKEKEISSSTSLAFTSTLSSLLASQSSSTSTTKPGRLRPSKTKEDIFTSHNRNTKKRAAKDLEDDDGRSYSEQKHKKDVGEVDASVLHRSKRKMEQKAKLYKQMKRGDLGDEDDDGGLVDFDRKWAEQGESSTSDEDDDGMNEVVDYEDEYGRSRRGTKAEAERIARRKANAVRGQEELDRMSARPAMPSKVIYGDTVQVAAFNPEDEVQEKMEELARKRDRSATPPEKKHYEADKEFRIKGVGFYTFSKDEGVREKEMEALERERWETERIRKEREGKKEARKREIEERRKEIAEKKAKKQADSFLAGLEADLGEQNG